MKLIAKVRPNPHISSSFKQSSTDLHIPKHSGDVGYDIEAAETVECEPYRMMWIPTNVHIEAQHPLWYIIAARSSIHMRGGIVPMGVIDSSYQGVIRVPLIAMGTGFKIQKGERFAQLIFFTHTHPLLEEVKEFGPSERGDRGFGSTGRLPEPEAMNGFADQFPGSDRDDS